jgi:anthranilate phosphoribosyltransferase
MLSELTQRLSAGEGLAFDEMSCVIDWIMQGGCAATDIGPFLLALRAKGEAVEELAGAAAAMRQHMTKIRSGRTNLVDTCGTGGGGKGTFNISTAAALIAAAAGASIAKHGNRKVTSKSGSADVLAALGVNVEAPVPVVERCLNELGICFCFAPLLHGSMKHVSAVRRELGVPTIFNLLGPLCNPASAPFQVLGVGRPETRTLLAAALARLGSRRAAVVCGENGLGEVTIAGATNVTLVEDGRLTETHWTPRDFGLSEVRSLDSLAAEDPADSARIIRGVLAGQAGPPRDIVLANAAAALWIVHPCTSLADCARRAANAIDSGSAKALLARLAILTNERRHTDADDTAG